jgi:Xaa-Pro aminopeptidase
MYPHQAERLGQALERAGLDALVATAPENVAYITGFRSLTEAVFHTPQFGVFTRKGTALVVSAFDAATVVADGIDVDHVACFGGFRATVAEPAPPAIKRTIDIMADRAATPVDALLQALEALDLRQGTIGLDENRLTHEAWLQLSSRLGNYTVVAGADQLRWARRIKGPYEIDCLYRALRITEESLDAVIQMLDPGVTEQEAARLYNQEVVKRHAAPIPSLIATGERTAIPAPWPTDRKAQRGELVRMEVGCMFKGYHGSLARTAVVGTPDPRKKMAYQAILAALEAVIDAVKPGVPAGRLCEIAIETARKAGLPNYDRYHVGHAIGLEPCERPKLARGIDTPLEAGELLRIETPYIELGWAGLNVRETVLVTAAGIRVLNSSKRDLIALV